MRHVTRAFLAGSPSDDPSQPQTVAAKIPIAAANYLIEAFAAIEAGADANNALGLNNRVGRTQKFTRHTVIAIEIDELRNQGISRDEAVDKIGKKYHLSFDGADSAYRLGACGSEFHKDLFDTISPEAAKHHLEYLRERHVKKSP